MNKKRFACLSFVGSALLLLLLFCAGGTGTGNPVAGGTGTGNPQVHAKITGTVVDSVGNEQSDVALELLPLNYNPAVDTQTALRDTTDTQGAYRLDGTIDSGSYLLSGIQLSTGNRFFRRNIGISDSALNNLGVDTLWAVQSVTIDIPSSQYVTGGLLYVPGTRISVSVDSAGPVQVDSVIVGQVNFVYYSPSLDSQLAVIPDSAIVLIQTADSNHVLFGIIVDSSGATVGGAQVVLLPINFNPVTQTVADSLVDTSDAQGHYSVSRPDSNSYFLVISDLAAERRSRRSVVITESSAVDLGTDTLGQTGVINAYIPDTLLVTDGRLFIWGSEINKAVPDSGVYTIDSVPAGTVDLGYYAATADTLVSTPGNFQNIIISPNDTVFLYDTSSIIITPDTLSGTLVNSSGTAVAGAHVVLLPINFNPVTQTAADSLMDTTDAQGRYVVSRPDSDSYFLVASDLAAAQRSRRSVVITESSTVDLGTDTLRQNGVIMVNIPDTLVVTDGRLFIWGSEIGETIPDSGIYAIDSVPAGTVDLGYYAVTADTVVSTPANFQNIVVAPNDTVYLYDTSTAPGIRVDGNGLSIVYSQFQFIYLDFFGIDWVTVMGASAADTMIITMFRTFPTDSAIAMAQDEVMISGTLESQQYAFGNLEEIPSGHLAGDLTFTTFDTANNISGRFSAGSSLYGISRTPSLSLVGSHATTGLASGVAITGTTVYVADGSGGVNIVNVSDPTLPVSAGTYPTPGTANGVMVEDSLLFVADGVEGLHILDISTRTSPQLLGTCNTPGNARYVVVFGSYAYVADEVGGMQIIDISNTALPQIVGNYGAAQGLNVLEVDAYNNYAYAACGDSGAHIVNTMFASSPSLSARFDTTGSCRSVSISDTTLFIANDLSGMMILDVSVPASPQYLGGFEITGVATGVRGSDEFAYLASQDVGFHVIDVKDPSAPILAGTQPTPGNSMGIVAQDGFAFIADGTGGLQVIEYAPKFRMTITGSFSASPMQ